MLGWAITFFVIAAMAAFLGFSGVAVAFAGVAKILFFVSLILLAITLAFGALPPGRFTGTARGAGVIVLGAIAGVGAYLWMDNGMSAERVGRSIDHGAAHLAQETERAADRTVGFVQTTLNETRDEAADKIDSDSE